MITRSPPSIHDRAAAARPPAPFVAGPEGGSGRPPAALREQVAIIMHDLQQLLSLQQSADGAWRYLLEGSVLPDAYLVIVQALYPPPDEELMAQLVQVIRRRQLAGGGWELYPDHGGDPSTTLEAIIALRMAGCAANDPAVLRAGDFLAAQADRRLSNLTRITCAALGILPWSAVPAIPAELMLLPPAAPGSIYDFVSYTRVHLPAMMILAATGYARPLPFAGEIRALLAPHQWDAFGRDTWAGRLALRLSSATQGLRRTARALPTRQRALRACRRYILDRVEPDGSVGSYILSTFFSMLALEALDHREDGAVIDAMRQALRSFVMVAPTGEPRMQPCTGTVWDTALNAALLRQMGVPAADERIQRAARWLLAREIRELPELRRRSPRMQGSAWGFQDVNRLFPDVDDTCAALEALRDLPGPLAQRADDAFNRAIDWVFQMQNPDGGWSAFDVGCNRTLLERIPFNDMRRAMTDPSSADMTGRTVAFVMTVDDARSRPAVQRALQWLRGDQQRDGSWFGRWGISYLYGTWAALLGFGAAGLREGDETAIDRACAWLRAVQNPDGGWGESCRSDEAGRFVQRSRSTPSQTGWALEALIAVSRAPLRDAAVLRAIEYLLASYQPGDGWAEQYPTGAGFAGKLYLYYHNYRNLWPAKALLRLLD